MLKPRVKNFKKYSKKMYRAIVIGGSLGGLEAVIAILSELPDSFPLPVIVVLHRVKNQKSELAEVIQSKCKIKVKEADEKEAILPGVVYISPANYHLLVEDEETFSLSNSELVNYSRPSIDVLFESAAEIYKENLTGILLTGANSDGSDGINLISQYGGLTIVQDPQNARCDIMPKSAILKTKVDYIVNLAEISSLLLKLNKETA